MKLRERLKLRKEANCWRQGYMKCPKCRERLPLSRAKPLTISKCRKCSRHDFVPLEVDSFWLYEPLGGGGRGSVYKAYHCESKLVCAVKIMRRDQKDDPQLIGQLESEASVLQEIGEHPNIVRLVSGGCADGEHYCAIEFVEGERLDHRVSRLGHVPEAAVVKMALDLLAAERHIYERGFLYRDLKPQNILVRENESHVLFDFGTCMRIDEAAQGTTEKFIEGSGYYMPPERIWRVGECSRSEIYSLGMVMYHALTGRTFFHSTQTLKELVTKHVSALRLSVTNVLTGQCNPRMAEVIDGMIRMYPEERFQTFDEVEEAIRDSAS